MKVAAERGIRRLLQLHSKGFAVEMPRASITPKSYHGPTYQHVLSTRKKHMPAFQFYFYKEPLFMTEGHGQYLFDYQGKQYLDLCSGISVVNCGHAHPRISKVISDQIAKLCHISPIFLQQYQGEYCKMLAEKLGPGFDEVFLVNSGAEANDFAMLLSRLYTGQQKILSLRNGYHGVVGSAQSVTTVGTWNHPVLKPSDFETVSWPNSYRGVLKGGIDAYIQQAEEVVNSCTSGRLAAFIAQPIQGVAGANPLPEGYLKRMYELTRKYGGLCICDEVQTGFGRIGKDFWGFKKNGVQPDIVTMAKGIGNGYPLAAVATRKEIMDSIKKVHFNTFGGGPIQSLVGMEVLKIIEDEQLHQNSQTVGAYLRSKLWQVAERTRSLGDVRGQGLFIGLQFVKDKKTKQPNPELTANLNQMFKEKRILMNKGGIFGNVFRLVPPLCLTKADADYIVWAIQDSIKKLE